MGIPLQLTLGRSKTEWERVNCGIFLYWHGRLIEAYKRVGRQVFSPDVGRGVIGVIDINNLMDDDDGNPWVMNNKQGFQDCETYVKMEEWLGNSSDEYWFKNFDTLDLLDLYLLSEKWKELVKKARAKQLSPNEYNSGTFTLSNLGMFGVDRFDAILPPGQGAIMAVGASKPTVSADKDGFFSVKSKMLVGV